MVGLERFLNVIGGMSSPRGCCPPVPALVIILSVFSHPYILSAKEELLTVIQCSNDTQMRGVNVCSMLNLVKEQNRACRRSPGVAETLLEATKLSVDECKTQFAEERWNCALGRYRQNILRKGFKETSFLYSITSAGLVHAFARACSLGRLDTCTCDQMKDDERWMSGCGDNIKFGLKFARRFLRRARKSGRDMRVKVNQHNSNVGFQVVSDYVRLWCKCHGYTGSCSVKTCWRQLSPFREVGTILKKRYEHSFKVGSYTNQTTGRSQLAKKFKLSNRSNVTENPIPRQGDLVYFEESPSFCKKSRFSPGTTGRVCDKDCDILCCGRGYNVQTAVVKRACQCRVIGDCYVECKQCNVTKEFYTCN